MSFSPSNSYEKKLLELLQVVLLTSKKYKRSQSGQKSLDMYKNIAMKRLVVSLLCKRIRVFDIAINW